MPKPNIAILTSCLTRGGAERAAGELSVKLAENANVFLFLLEKKPVTYNYSGQIIQLQFEEYYKKYRKMPLGIILSKFAYLKIIYDVINLKNIYHIDLSISFLETLNIINLLSKRKEKIYLSIRNNRSMQNKTFQNKIENFLIKYFYRYANRVIALSYGVKNDLIKNFKLPEDKIIVIYNYVNINDINKKSKEEIPLNMKKIIDNKKVILSMGRYVEQKNFFGLIDAFSIVSERFQDTVLIILGKGELKEQLIEKINTLGLSEKVFCIDYLENPMPLIKKSDIFVMNSVFEGLCNSIIEAMVCGTLIISTDCKYGPREIIADRVDYEDNIDYFMVCNNGILVPVLNKIEMAKAIIFAIENQNKLEVCRNNALKKFNQLYNKHINQQWLDLVEEQDKC